MRTQNNAVVKARRLRRLGFPDRFIERSELAVRQVTSRAEKTGGIVASDGDGTKVDIVDEGGRGDAVSILFESEILDLEFENVGRPFVSSWNFLDTCSNSRRKELKGTSDRIIFL